MHQTHCVLQEFDEIVFENLETLREFHKKEGDPHTTVPGWENGTRVIRFSVPLTGVPDIVKTAIGMLLRSPHSSCLTWLTNHGTAASAH